MAKVNPHLREQWESLPIEVKNRLLESDVTIETEEDLHRCVEWLEAQNSCCGDL